MTVKPGHISGPWMLSQLSAPAPAFPLREPDDTTLPSRAVRTTKDRLSAALRAMRQKTEASVRVLAPGQGLAELRHAEAALATADLVLGALPGEVHSVMATLKQTGLRLDQVRIHDVICHGHVLLSNIQRTEEPMR